MADTPRLLARGLVRPLVWSVMALMTLLAAWATVAVAIPRAAISPSTDLTNIRTDRSITVEVPRFTSISRVEVTVNAVQKWLEYNIQGNSYTAPLQLDPASDVTVTVKATSPLGFIREFDSTFHTMEAMQLSTATAAGKPLTEGGTITNNHDSQ